jgi:hypothetical protein
MIQLSPLLQSRPEFHNPTALPLPLLPLLLLLPLPLSSLLPLPPHLRTLLPSPLPLPLPSAVAAASGVSLTIIGFGIHPDSYVSVMTIALSSTDISHATAPPRCISYAARTTSSSTEVLCFSCHRPHSNCWSYPP